MKNFFKAKDGRLSNRHKSLLGMLVLALILGLSLLGCANTQDEKPNDQAGEVQESDEEVQAAVKNVVENFGKKLQNVSLLAPKEQVAESMEENYGEYVAPALLEQWKQDPQKAPGRLTSSPWPDQIEILNMNKVSEEAYHVKGEIIEVTNVEKESGEVAAKREINLTVVKIDERWFINSVELGDYVEGDGALNNGTDNDSAAANTNTNTNTNGNANANTGSKLSLVYKNEQYGFSFALPESWKNYKIITEEWEGRWLEDAPEGKNVEKGPLISIRHPLWTEKNPRQDIPMLILTHQQWNSVQQEILAIGAAPVPPSKLGSNDKYVFALPARYNYAFPEGFEEVEDILASNPLQTN